MLVGKRLVLGIPLVLQGVAGGLFESGLEFIDPLSEGVVRELRSPNTEARHSFADNATGESGESSLGRQRTRRHGCGGH